jgi:hypothetical protein
MKRSRLSQLVSLTRAAIQDLRIPDVDVSDISARKQFSPRFITDKPIPYYVVTITTDNPAALRGSSVFYKGSYKERIEGVLQRAVTTDSRAIVHVDIVGRRDGSLDRWVSVRSSVASGAVRADSPIVRTAQMYDIPAVQYHGRHLVGPSPAVAEVVRRHVQRAGVPRRLLDLFAGTGIVTAVVTHMGRPEKIVVVDRDDNKLRKLQARFRIPELRCVAADACTFRLTERFDLVVADPYYEDASAFWDHWEKAPSRFIGHFVFVSGNVEDVAWNRRMAKRLRETGWTMKAESLFGQTIYSGYRA